MVGRIDDFLHLSPSGDRGTSLTGINSSPLISQLVCCLVVSQPFRLVVRTSRYSIKEVFLLYAFLCLPVFVQDPELYCTSQPFYSTMEGTWVSHQQTLDTVSVAVSSVRSPLPPAFPRAVLLLEPCVVKYWEQRWYAACIDTAVILNDRLYVSLGGQTNHSHQHISHKRNCKYRHLAFRLAHCFQNDRKHHVTLWCIVTEKRELFVLGESCLKKSFLRTDTKTWLRNNSVVKFRSELGLLNWFFLTSQSYFLIQQLVW